MQMSTNFHFHKVAGDRHMVVLKDGCFLEVDTDLLEEVEEDEEKMDEMEREGLFILEQLGGKCGNNRNTHFFESFEIGI